MAEKLGEALLDLDTNDKGLHKGVDRAERRATALGRTFDDVSRRAALLGKAMVTAATVGAAAFTAGIAGAVKRLEYMRKAGAQVDQALKNSGNTARTSAAEIEAWADALEDRTGRAAEEVMELSANLASFGFGREEFFRALTLADDMAAAWGGDLRQNLEGLSRALDDPINGMAMLSKRGIKLTQDQKDMAAAFLDAGNKVAAQGVVFEALEAQVKGVAEAGFNGLGAAIARAQKRWEDAFEDLVTGKGDASDLRDTLVDLADTLSSPEFIKAAMGFGSTLAEGIGVAAQAVIALWGKVKEFLAWLDGQQAAANSESGLVDRLAAQEANLAQLRAAREGGGWGAAFVGSDGNIRRAEQGVANLRAQLDALRNGPKFDPVGDGAGEFATFARTFVPGTMAGQGNVDPYEGLGNGAGEASEKVRDLIADLQHEREIVGLSTLDQEIMNTVRLAGVDAMSAEGLEIRRLITETAEHRDQIEQMQEVYELLGDIGKSAVMGLVDALEDGQVEGNELLGILGNVLSMAGSAFLNWGFEGFGAGPGKAIGDFFAGLFADGGLIPNGSFGIAGEDGPEPVFATSRGTRVMSNPDFRGAMSGGRETGDMYLTINGSGLSPSELTQAVRDAIGTFSRYELPSRVRAINADPLAVG